MLVKHNIEHTGVLATHAEQWRSTEIARRLDGGGRRSARIHVRENAGEFEHFAEQERDVWDDDDDERLHDAQVVREARRPGAGEAEHGPDEQRADDDDDERHDRQHAVDGDHVLLPDLTHLREHVIEHLHPRRPQM